MSLVTKGMGSNCLITSGFGYAFSYGALVQPTAGGGGSGGGRARYRRSYAERIDSLHMARRPRRDGPTIVEHDSVESVDLQPSPAAREGEQRAVRSMVDTGTKVVCVVGIGLACLGVFLL